ncbi:MAG: hypothetical protein KAX49_14495 [Halanaerobiales bacterium]|nr:hypothetical protein [Halanaerobiales bacterium]
MITPEEKFENSVHKIGRITILIIIISVLIVPVFIWMFYGIFPPLNSLVKGIITISSFMIPLSIAEILSFYPILGSSGIYMAYTTGNIANLKVPSSAIGMEVVNVEPGTKEGNIISIIAMAGSVIVSELLLLISMIMIVPISEKLTNSIFQPAFEQILPALFGALGAYYIFKEWKLAVVPLAISIVFYLIGDFPTAITVPICVLSSILGAKYLYKKGQISAT